MAAMRIVNIHMDATAITSMKVSTDPKQWQEAIGYLSTWNLTFPKVTIRQDGETDMVAVYYTGASVMGYVIGAVWHEDHYEFHS